MQPDLIYDVGMNDGYDAAFYLACGFRVVAVEADPVLASAAAKRFQAEVEAGRLVILNVAIAEHGSLAEFWINDSNPALSSFRKETATRFGDTCRPIQVQCERLDRIVAQHGIPYYLKIDIEDYDIVGCRQLTAETRPTYISVEMTQEALGTELLDCLSALGYDRFKIIDQRHLLPVGHQKRNTFGPIFWPLYRIANYHKENRMLPLRMARAAVAKVLTFAQDRRLWGGGAFKAGRLSSWQFKEGSSSGTFGEDLPGEWLSREEVTRLWAAELEELRGLGQFPWHDIHATVSTRKS